MPAEGHRTRRSEEQASEVSTANPGPVRASRITLGNYAPVQPKRLQPALAAIIGVETAPPGGETNHPDAASASFGDAAMLEAVIGNDDRVRVSQADLRKNPFRQICALRIKARTGAMFVGTGWLIGARALATAGHCVYMQQEGGWAEFIEVIPAKFGSDAPIGRFRATRFRAVDGWIDRQSRDFDYGVILLDDGKPGDQVGWFTVADESDRDLMHTQANISGYPADKDNANFQYFHARPLASVTPTRLIYDVDTFGGQSGSPVWQHTDTGFAGIGIHTTGGVSSNSGTRIGSQVIENLSRWRDE